MTKPGREIDRVVENDGRRARVTRHTIGTDSFGVAMFTYYLGKWYYDGKREFPTLQKAIRYRDDWLNRTLIMEESDV